MLEELNDTIEESPNIWNLIKSNSNNWNLITSITNNLKLIKSIKNNLKNKWIFKKYKKHFNYKIMNMFFSKFY